MHVRVGRERRRVPHVFNKLRWTDHKYPATSPRIRSKHSSATLSRSTPLWEDDVNVVVGRGHEYMMFGSDWPHIEGTCAHDYAVGVKHFERHEPTAHRAQQHRSSRPAGPPNSNSRPPPAGQRLGHGLLHEPAAPQPSNTRSRARSCTDHNRHRRPRQCGVVRDTVGIRRSAPKPRGRGRSRPGTPTTTHGPSARENIVRAAPRAIDRACAQAHTAPREGVVGTGMK